MFNLCEKLKMNNYAKTQYDHNEITEILNGVNLDELSYEEKFKLIDLKIGHSGENFVIRNTMKKHPECNYKKIFQFMMIQTKMKYSNQSLIKK